jgi:N-acyl-D-amino-acid deacylase
MHTRRDFVATGGAVLLGLSTPAILRHRFAYDLVIRGATLFDGTGAPGVESDIAINAGRIASIQRRISDTGREEIDAKGKAACPGFIDIHSHGDSSLAQDPRAESLIRQGITTIVVGQDGGDNASDEHASFATMLGAIDKLAPSVNVTSMVGLGSVRGAVVGDVDRPARSDELAKMVALVESALAQGACGASSGLEYTPGAFASREELIALCRPLSARGLPYATHMRNEDDRVLEAIDEAIAVAAGAGCPLQISHLKTQGPRNWGRLDQAFARIASAKSGGMNIAFDRYPYIAYQTGLTNLFPVWSRDGGTDAFLARLVDSTTAARIRQETLAKVSLIGGWDNVMIASVSALGDSAVQGRRLGAFAASQSLDPFDATVALLQRNRGSVGMVGFAMSEDNLDRILAHPLGMVCSDGGSFAIDGPTRRGSPHPRGLGTFPRILGRYVRERKVLTLSQAINKMTAFPASRVKIADRGRLASGLAADLVVFDPATVTDKATFESPFQYPEGIEAVIVNGHVAFREGERRPGGFGKSLRPR